MNIEQIIKELETDAMKGLEYSIGCADYIEEAWFEGKLIVLADIKNKLRKEE